MKSSARSRTLLATLLIALAVTVVMRGSMLNGSADMPHAAGAIDDDPTTPGDEATSPGAHKTRGVSLPPSWMGATWPPDPFQRRSDVLTGPTVESAPAVAAALDKPPFVLNATMVGVVPMALVDGRPVGLGEIVGDGWEVTEIDAVSVTLRGRSGSLVLRLPE